MWGKSVGLKASIANIFMALAALVAAAAVFLSATDAGAQAFRFSTIIVEGNERVRDETVISIGGLSEGEGYSAAELNDAAQAIRASGFFDEVEIDPVGARLTITVVEFPTIRLIAFEGNARITDEELALAIESQERFFYSLAQAERDVEAITEVYAQRGRIAATVVARTIEREGNLVDLVFEIVEGEIVEIERISFVGNRTFSDRRLRGILESRQAGLLRVFQQNDTFVADRIAFDEQVLTDFYRSNGFVDFVVQSVDVTLTRDRSGFLITFNIQEGQRYRVGEVNIVSEIAGADPDVYGRAVRLNTGEIYSPVSIDEDIARIEELAVDNELPFLRVEPRIDRDDRNLSLSVTYVLIEGDRVFIERIDIEGNTTTLDRVIRREFDVVEGDPFNARVIRAAAARIRALNFFATSSVDTREGSSPDRVIVEVDVVERPTGEITFGANFNSDNGLSLTAGISETNFLGRGQSLDFDLSLSERRQLISFGFTEPAVLDGQNSFFLRIRYATTNNSNADYDTETFVFRPGLGFPVGQRSRLTVNYELAYTDLTGVRGEAGDPPADRASLKIFEEADQGGIVDSLIGYAFTYDTRRSGLDPTRGVVLRFSQELAGIGGDRSFLKTTAEIGGEVRLLSEAVTVRATVEGGALNFADGDESRVTDRYFMGSTVMRGFQPGGIGPRDADTDDALGGELFAVARLETTFPVGVPEEYGLRGGAFVDYGSVWQVGNTDSVTVLYDEFTPRMVVGASIFWSTPIGPLRFNFTDAIIKEEFDRERTFDVTISTQF